MLTRDEDPIELTLDQVRAAISVKDGSEAIATAQTLLARAGVLKRLDSNANYAVIRIDSNAPTLLDFLPKEAKLRRTVMLAIEKIVGNRRGDDVYVRPDRLLEKAGVSREQLTRTLRELRKLKAFDYIPPFRGRAVRFIERDIPFEHLQIDFEELDRRKRAEFEKLEAVIDFARTSGCRQRVILNYFGETDCQNCGTCDRCKPVDGSIGRGSDVSLAGELKGVDSALLKRGVQVVLSGVTRMHGRFGKNMIAQMLCGSKNKKLQQWKLHRLSTYGLLSALRQMEVVAVMDALIEAGLLQQKEVDDRRPTVHVTDEGRQVMLSESPLPSSLQMSFPMAKRLAIASGQIESGDVQTDSAGIGKSDAVEESSSEAAELVERLKRWRQKTSAAQGIPAYRVLTNATIDRIAEMVPDTTDQLEAIPGIGPATMEQYGYDIIEVIRQSTSTGNADPAPINGGDEIDGDSNSAEVDCPDFSPAVMDDGMILRSDDFSAATSSSHLTHDVPVPKSIVEDAADCDESVSDEIESPDHVGMSKAERDQQGDPGDAYWTWRLFRDGYTANQIAAIRRREISSLIDDLAVARSAGHELDQAWLANSEDSRRLFGGQPTSPVGG